MTSLVHSNGNLVAQHWRILTTNIPNIPWVREYYAVFLEITKSQPHAQQDQNIDSNAPVKVNPVPPPNITLRILTARVHMTINRTLT